MNKPGEKFQIDQFGRQHLKQTLPNGIRLYRWGAWGGNGFGSSSEWYAVAPDDTVLSVWENEPSGRYIRSVPGLPRFYSDRFNRWKAMIAACQYPFPEPPLIAAYHAIFDEKDRHSYGSPESYAAYEALSKLEVVILNAGLAVPERFDNKVAVSQ